MSAIAVFVLGLGAFLIWCGMKDENPKQVLLDVLQGNR